MKKGIIAALVAVLAVGSVQAEKLVIKGSDTLGAKLVPQIKEAFVAKNPGVTFEIAAEGSSTGIAAVIDGTADIGMSSRRAKPQEVTSALAKGVKMKPTIAALDGIGVIVNENNPVGELTLQQVEDIFTGNVTDWSELGGKAGTISVYTRNTASGTYSDFKKIAMSSNDYGSATQKMAGNEQIASEVSKNPNGIGYVGLAYINASGIKTVAVDGAQPTEAAVKAMQYPIARPTFYYTNGEPAGLAKQFIEFATGPEGAKIIRQVGFVPSK
ncbi:MAG: phosphate ABC transporter substrate-binding protein [Verrucomicrobiota bacterium]